MPRDNQNLKGWTELKLAAWKNLEKCVEVLLECGAHPDVADHGQYTALHNAINYQPGHCEVTADQVQGRQQAESGWGDGSLHRIRMRVDGFCPHLAGVRGRS